MTEAEAASAWVRNEWSFGREKVPLSEDFHFEEVDFQNGPKHRWYEEATTILKCEETGRYWGYDWQEGLTEKQEHEFPDHPAYEVVAKEITKKIWIKK